MLDISKVPVVDNDVKIRSYIALDGTRYIILSDTRSCSELYFSESKFNKCFKVFKNVLKNEDEYRKLFLSGRGHKWFRPRDIDTSLNGNDYFMVDRVPIYVEMLKYISKYKVCLDRDSLLSQNVDVLETVSKRIKKCKKLNRIEGLPYLSL